MAPEEQRGPVWEGRTQREEQNHGELRILLEAKAAKEIRKPAKVTGFVHPFSPLHPRD